jgi:asparagine synthase (glutamine-hydrolysing)
MALMGIETAGETLKDMDPSSLMESMVGKLSIDSMAAVGQLESTAYMRNQLLRDSDWASMAHSVELRTPLVDAWLLRDLMPVLRSFGRYKGKKLLAASPRSPLSNKIINRPKTGFGVPLGIWKQESMAVKEGATQTSVTQGGDDSRKWAQAVAKAVYKTA